MELEKSAERAELLDLGWKAAPFKGNTAVTARTGTYCAKPAQGRHSPEPRFGFVLSLEPK